MNYYRKAIEQGYEEAREWMEQLQKNLVDETITDIEIPQDKSDEELYKDAKNALEKAQFKTGLRLFFLFNAKKPCRIVQRTRRHVFLRQRNGNQPSQSSGTI